MTEIKIVLGPNATGKSYYINNNYKNTDYYLMNIREYHDRMLGERAIDSMIPYDLYYKVMSEAQQKIVEDAINILQAISFVTEAEEKTLLCEKKLAELKAAQQERDEAKKEKDKKDTLVGVIFFVFFLLLVVLLIAGAAYIIYHLKLGDLSPTAIKVIISVIAVLVILTVIGKLKS